MKRLFLPLAAALALQLPGIAEASPNAAADQEYLSDEDVEADEDILDLRLEEALRSNDAPGQRSSRYPIVFVHGFMGWDEILNVDYFYQVRKTLEQAGFEVYTPSVNPINSIEVRTRQLAPQLDAIFAQSGAEKINIIAHSMGGMDARYLIANGYGHRIASLTTIGTPHRGTPVPDFIFRVLGKGNNLIYKAFEYVVCGLIGQGKVKPSELDLRATLWNLSHDYMENWFNPRMLDNPNIYYQSYAGVSSITGWKTGDRLDPLLLPFQAAFGHRQRNDGLVPEESAKWGRFRGHVSADHIDLIGQLLGQTSARYRHLTFYQKLAEELSDMGF
jgi:triacylglycerol lipase